MRMSQGGWWLGVVAAVCFGACETDEADGQDPGVRDFDENGFRLNGFRLNGFRLNGFRLDGFALTGGDGDAIQLEEIRLAKGSKGKGSQVTSAWLAGSELRVETDAGKQLSGPQLKGAELVFTVREGETTAQKTVRIVKVKPLANGGDVWLYDLKIRQGTGAWYPLCIDHRGTPTEAILLRGVWDPVTGDRITPEPGQATTFACRDAALGKCVEWGYPPSTLSHGTYPHSTHFPSAASRQAKVTARSGRGVTRSPVIGSQTSPSRIASVGSSSRSAHSETHGPSF
jgi:hypothetical protein